MKFLINYYYNDPLVNHLLILIKNFEKNCNFLKNSLITIMVNVHFHDYPP